MEPVPVELVAWHRLQYSSRAGGGSSEAIGTKAASAQVQWMNGRMD